MSSIEQTLSIIKPDAVERNLTENIKQDNILEYGVKFSSMVNIGDNLLCTGYVDDIFKKNSKTLLKIKLGVKDQNGDKKLDGYTIVDIP